MLFGGLFPRRPPDGMPGFLLGALAGLGVLLGAFGGLVFVAIAISLVYWRLARFGRQSAGFPEYYFVHAELILLLGIRASVTSG